MSGHTYKKIEITGSSSQGIQDAVDGALHKASDSVRNMRWFEVTEIRGTINEQKVQDWQVTLKIGFDVE